ncbi:MAG: hypothetical protein ACYC9S_13830 [Leptospirales bacterium]
MKNIVIDGVQIYMGNVFAVTDKLIHLGRLILLNPWELFRKHSGSISRSFQSEWDILEQFRVFFRCASVPDPSVLSAGFCGCSAGPVGLVQSVAFS